MTKKMKDAIIVVGSDIDAYECNLTNFNLGSKAGGWGGCERPVRMLPQHFCFLTYISRSFDLLKQSHVPLLSHRFYFAPDPPGRGSSHRLLLASGPSSAKPHRTLHSLLHRRSPASADRKSRLARVRCLVSRFRDRGGGGLVCTEYIKSYCFNEIVYWGRR